MRKKRNGWSRKKCFGEKFICKRGGATDVRFPGDRGGAPIRPDSIQQRAREVGLSEFIIYGRLKRGWPVEKALATPRKIKYRPGRKGMR